MPMTWPWSRPIEDLQATADRIEADTNSLVAGQGRITRTIERIVTAMADQSALLNSVAEGLRNNLGPAVAKLVAENATLRARNAELEGEDTAESQAASDVKVAYDDLAGQFTNEPSVPDVEPLPEPGTDPGVVPEEPATEVPAEDDPLA